MADEQNTPQTAPATDPSGGAQPEPQQGGQTDPNQTQDPGQQIDPNEYQRLKRLEAQYQGSNKLASAAANAGLKQPEDIQYAMQGAEIMSKLRERGVSPDNIDSILQGQSLGQHQQAGGQPDQTAQAAQLQQTQQPLDENAIAGIIQRENMRVRHDSDWEQMSNGLSSKLDELSGGNEHAEKLLAPALEDAARRRMGTYPTGHPLAGKKRPITQNEIEQAAQEVASAYQSIAAQQSGSSDNPTQSAVNGTAPLQSGGGTTDNAGGNSIAGSKPFWDMSKQEKNQALKASMSARMQNHGARSAVGGGHPVL